MFKRLHFFMLSILFSVNLPAQTEVKIDIDKEYQTIDNFGASDCWSMQKIGAWAEPQKERVADLLFSVDKGIGLSAWRFNIGGGYNPYISHSWRTVETFEVAAGEYDWLKQEEERWFLQAAKERSVDQFIAFVNSPPGRMTRNGRTHCSDGLGSTNLKEGFEQQYATYLVDILKHFRDEWGINFEHISPVNEPQWEWNNSNQEGNRASDMDIKLIVNALHAELEKQQVETEISLVESGDLRSWYEYRSDITSKYNERYGNYLTELFGDKDIVSKVSKHLGGHSYWSDRVANELVQHRQNLYIRMSPFLNDGWKYWMTEYCVMVGPDGEGGNGKDLTIKTALNVARNIHYDLTVSRASAWQWWTAVSPEDYKDGLIYTNYKDFPTTQNIYESKLLWALGNFSRFIRPGSVRVRVFGANDINGLLGSAYLSSARDKLIVVLINMSETDKPVIIRRSGLAANEKITYFTPYITSSQTDDDLKKYPAFSADSSYTILSRSIVTLVGEIIDTSDVDLFHGDYPEKYELFQNFPNPFNKDTKMYYYIPNPGKVNISIYSMLGEKIKTIIDNEQPTGTYNISWNGTNDNDELVSSGLYLYSMQFGNKKTVKKMMFIQ